MESRLDGLLSFYSWHHALRAERVLLRAGHSVELIPGPRELSPNCGTALRFIHARLEQTLAVLSEKNVQIEAAHEYLPELELPTAARAPESGIRNLISRWVKP